MTRSPFRQVRPRRGNYSTLLALALVMLLGFGALAIDIAYMRLAQAQAQDIADAASHAALLALRQTGSQREATAAARTVLNSNRIAGGSPELEQIVFGAWDDSAETPSFVPTNVRPNAVRVTVSRSGDRAISYNLAGLFGKENFGVRSSAVAASRTYQIIFVMDITNSWSEANFLHAREAAVIALEMLTGAASGVDEVGMTLFTNRFAWEYTPLTRVAVGSNAENMLADWGDLNTASKAGKDKNHSDGRNCELNSGSKINDFNNPVRGGCYPDMPREYRDEPGTDHSTGMELARQMFDEGASGAVYRAMIVVTDGQPNGLGSPGTARAADGYEEDRWREYVGPAPRTTNEVRNASITSAQQMWDELQVNTWIVSYVADDWFMDQVPQGDGYKVVTNNASQLENILAQIISEMPVALVE